MNERDKNQVSLDEQCASCSHQTSDLPCSDERHSALHRRHSRRHPDDVAYISCVKHRYADGTTIDLCGMDFCAHKGERTVLLGPNGSGKSTLLYHLLGVLTPDEGTVAVLGKNPLTDWAEIRQRIGVVIQNVNQQLIMPTVFDDIAFSARQYGVVESDIPSRVERVASLVDVKHLYKRTPHSLSGGEKRRVALAGALIMDPELLILDEPFEGLDPEARYNIIKLLHDLSHVKGVSIIMTTHDIDSVAEFADYCYVLRTGGTIALSGTPAQLFSHVHDLQKSNIRPPIIAELFSALNDELDGHPLPLALTVEQAKTALLEWKDGRLN